MNIFLKTANSATPEQRGEDVSGRLIFNPEDVVSLSLEYIPPGVDPLTILSTNDMDASNLNGVNASNNNNGNNGTVSNKRYLQCPALVTIAHLKKFIAMKYSVDVTRYTIEICHRRAPLPEHWTLMDVAYIYAWKRVSLNILNIFRGIKFKWQKKRTVLYYIIKTAPPSLFFKYRSHQ